MIDPVLIAAVITSATSVVVTIILTKRNVNAKLTSIEVKVDGRLESAYVKIDALAGMIATLTGTVAPPPVSKQNSPAAATAEVAAIVAASQPEVEP